MDIEIIEIIETEMIVHDKDIIIEETEVLQEMIIKRKEEDQDLILIHVIIIISQEVEVVQDKKDIMSIVMKRDKENRYSKNLD